jgi:hypothetical protein
MYLHVIAGALQETKLEDVHGGTPKHPEVSLQLLQNKERIELVYCLSKSKLEYLLLF